MEKVGRNLGLLLFVACLWVSKRTEAATVDDFVREPDIYSVEISPDGKTLATVRNFKGRRVLQTLSIQGLKPIGEFGLAGDFDVGDVYWVSNDRLMIGWARRLGTNGKPEYTGDLMAVDVDGKNTETLLSGERNSVYGLSNFRDFTVVDGLPGDPKHALIARYERREESTPWLTSINVNNGAVSRIAPGRSLGTDFYTDDDGDVRLQVGHDNQARIVVHARREKGGGWEEVVRAFANEGKFYPEIFNDAEELAYVSSNVDAPTFGLFSWDLKTGQQKKIIRDNRYDLDQVIYDKKSKRPILATWDGARYMWKVLDGTHPHAGVWMGLLKAFDGMDVMPVSFSNDRSVAVFLTVSDVSPVTYYVIDLDKKNVLAKLPSHPWINPAELSNTHAVRFAARDGTELDAFLTLPKSRPTKGNPLVVLPHGGPFGVRDDWRYSSEVQYLASQGYAVLRVNFRGSGGYGREFLIAGYRGWGRVMQDDLADATQWAINNGFASSNKICMYGASYGAYAAMMALVTYPKLYKCAVGYAGLYDLDYWYKEIRTGSSRASSEWFESAVGTHDQLSAISPVSQASRIRSPVLLIHGGEDRVTPPEHFEQMVSALKSAGGTYETLYRKEEGHGFYDPNNQKAAFVSIKRFLDRNIGK